MKRLLIAVVLMMVVLAVVAAPAFAYLDSQAGAPVGAPHAVADAHHHSSADVATAAGKTAPVVVFRAHGRHIGMVPASTGGNALSIALLALLVIGLSAAAFAEGRQAPARQVGGQAGAPASLQARGASGAQGRLASDARPTLRMPAVHE